MTDSDMVTSRRKHLKLLGSTAAAAALAATGLEAAGQAIARGRAGPGSQDTENYDFLLARARFDCSTRGTGARWNVYPGGDRHLLEEFSAVVRARVKIPTGCSGTSPAHGDESLFNAVVSFEDAEALRNHPFVFMTGEGTFTFTRTQKANLKRYVNEGGFLLIDDCVLAPAGDFLYQSAYKMLEETFGRGSLVRIPNTHEVFHNVYDLTATGLPHCQGKNHGARGVFLGDRLAVFLSATDIHCGWADRNRVFFPRGTTGYKESIQMGINIIMYAMSH